MKNSYVIFPVTEKSIEADFFGFTVAHSSVILISQYWLFVKLMSADNYCTYPHELELC